MKDQDNKQLIKNWLNPIKTQARIGKGKNRNSWHHLLTSNKIIIESTIKIKAVI